LKLGIKWKLLPVVVLGIVILSATFYFFAIQIEAAGVNSVTLDGIHAAKKSFYDLEQNDIRTLKASLTGFVTNQQYRDIYNTNDRDALYNATSDLYGQYKTLGITQFSFIGTDSHTFLRMAKPSYFGERVTRTSFITAQKTHDWGTGLDLDATAFALRVVHPYYNGNTVIGYVEYGEEINDFIRTIKQETGNDYGIVIKKQFIDPTQWATIRRTAGLANNYDDLPDYVVVDSTTGDVSDFKSYGFTEKDLDTVTDEGNIFSGFSNGRSDYVSGGFALYDGSGTKLGAVVVIENVTPMEAAARQTNLNVLIVVILATVIIGAVMVIFVNRIIIKPLDRIVEETTRVAGGDFDTKIDVQSDDEIGALAEMIDGFRQIVMNMSKELEENQQKKE
jgi:HAMP domain-containing protein